VGIPQNVAEQVSTLSLDISVQATVDANGVATTLPVGPSRYKEIWVIERYSISLAGGAGSICRIYEGYVEAQRQRDYTQQGEGDTAAGAMLELQVGDTLVAEWTGATNAIGAVATIAFRGTIELAGRRTYR
jgi:hypothetical protein